MPLLRWLIRFVLQLAGVLAVFAGGALAVMGGERARWDRCNAHDGYWDDDRRICVWFGRCPDFGRGVPSVGAPFKECELAEAQLPEGRAWWTR